jgi:hypothetical protein
VTSILRSAALEHCRQSAPRVHPGSRRSRLALLVPTLGHVWPCPRHCRAVHFAVGQTRSDLARGRRGRATRHHGLATAPRTADCPLRFPGFGRPAATRRRPQGWGINQDNPLKPRGSFSAQSSAGRGSESPDVSRCQRRNPEYLQQVHAVPRPARPHEHARYPLWALTSGRTHRRYPLRNRAHFFLLAGVCTSDYPYNGGDGTEVVGSLRPR